MSDKLTDSDNNSATFTGHNLKIYPKISSKNIAGFTLSFVLVLSQIFLGSTISFSEPHAFAATIPSPPTNVVATSNNSTSLIMPTVVITWTASTGATSYTVYRSTSSSSGYAALNSTSTTSYTDDYSNISALTTYYYEITATNATGTSTLSTPPTHASTRSVLCMTNMAMPNCTPLAPLGVTATPLNAGQINLQWTPSDGPAKEPTLCDTCTYTIWRSAPNSTSGYTQIVTGYSSGTSNTAVTYNDTYNISRNTSYGYEINATWYPPPPAGLIGPSSPPVYAKTYGLTPTASTGLKATGETSTENALTWNAVSGATGYKIYRANLVSGPFIYDGTNSTNPTGTYFSDNGGSGELPIISGYTYYYEVVTVVSGSQSLLSSPVSVTTIPSAPIANSPTALTGGTSILVSWAASANATSYNIYRSTTTNASSAPSGTYPLIGTSTTLSYADNNNGAGLAPTTKYWYKFSATDSGGTSFQSAPAKSGTTLAHGAPGVPMGVTATALSTSSIHLSWTASGGNSYVIFRSLSSSGPFAKPSVGTNSSSMFTNIGLAAGTTYWYEINATNQYGSSALSTPAVSATTLGGSAPSAPTGVTATAISSSQINLSWTASSGATSYSVYGSTSSSGPFTTLNGTSTTTSFSDTGLHPGVIYYFEITASNANGASALSTPPVSATTNAVYARLLVDSFTISDVETATKLAVGTCGIGLSTSTINYGTVTPGSTPIHAQNTVGINNTGTVSSTLMVIGANWLSGVTSEINANQTQLSTTGAAPWTSLANGYPITIGTTGGFAVAPHATSYTTTWQLIPKLLNVGFAGSATQQLSFATSC